MRDFIDPTDPPWWQHAVCYQVYVRSFADADGDGIGDLAGITDRLPYLRDLGVDALWITPFYSSPQRDHGYDVARYTDVDPRFGTLADADALLDRAHGLGLRVLLDIVPNHTSDQHPWFPAALAAVPGSTERARYLFREGRGDGGDQPPNNWRSVFGGPAWTRVEESDGRPGQWFLHLFDTTQPDLDWRNPEVADMFDDVLRFWLDRGVDGFRIDVAHGLFKDASLRDQEIAEVDVDGESEARSAVNAEGGMVTLHTRDEPMWDQPEVHDVYRRWHQVFGKYDGDRVTVAEAWASSPEALARYVRPDELTLAFNFDWLIAPWSAQEFARVIERTFATLDPVGATPTWVLSNHDVVRTPTRYGGGPRGLARARAAVLAMLALPGSAYLYQGEELGLEQVDVPPALRQDPSWLRTGEVGRDGCRVPMPWGGSEAPYGFGPGTGQPWLPQPAEWADLTVEAQTGDPASTLELYRTALAARRTLRGDAVDLLDLGRDVLAFRRGEVTVVLNCGRRSVPVPDGEVVIASGELAPGVRRRAGRGGRATLPPDTAAWLTPR